jgi:uncharacterized surface protein with fasciclin (FAS1) repeats
MKHRKAVAIGTAATAALALGATSLVAGTSAAAASGTSLAEVLTSDNNTFDRNSGDFDIATEAVLAVVGAKPGTPVALLADPSAKLTAFVPTDQAFLNLASDLTGKKVKKEKKAFKTVASLGIDTVETVLLYHVVPGAKVTSAKALKADGAKLATAQGGTIKVKVKSHPTKIKLVDKDRNARNAKVDLSLVDINKAKGNKQIAHGISEVLRPVDLPPTA